MKKSKPNVFFALVVILNIMLLVLRLTVGDASSFGGNIFSVLIFLIIACCLLFFFITKKYDYFIITWLCFYYASPILNLPFASIGTLGILNVIFIPLMVYKIFDLKNKYFITILILFLIGILHIADVNFRLIISKIMLFLAPFVFFYFVIKKCKDVELIMWSSILITLINVPLGVYELVVKPEWGVSVDWRGSRIFGNLFWHNAYSLYLLPSIMTLYAFFRKTAKKSYLALMILLVVMDIFTLSRDGLFTLAITLIVFEALHKTGFKATYKKIAIAGLLILGIILYLTIMPALDTHFTPATLWERTSIWDSITPFIKGNIIFGNGLGSYEVYRENFLHGLSSHNYYLNVVFELGLIGLVLFLLFIRFIFKDLKKKLYSKKSFRASELGIAFLVGILLFSFFGNGAFTQVVSLNLWIIIACCVGHDEKHDEKEKD